MVTLKRRIGREVETILRRQHGCSTSVLIAGQHSINLLEIERGPDNAALVTVVPGQNPKAIFPFIVDDVVHVANTSG